MPIKPEPSPSAHFRTFRWLGSQNMHLDVPHVARCGDTVIGCYGGCTRAGAVKNEDAAMVWQAEDGMWTFAALLDAHATPQSAELVLKFIAEQEPAIVSTLSQPREAVFGALHQLLASVFASEAFRRECRNVQGETACLICAQKGRFLFWFSIGDCLVYLLHPDLFRMGQSALNQRSFFEWVGRQNAFDLPEPCYASGVRELRNQMNTIVMVTDGLLEFGERPLENPQRFFDHFVGGQSQSTTDLATRVHRVLQCIHEGHGRDSATIVSWQRSNSAGCMQPSA